MTENLSGNNLKSKTSENAEKIYRAQFGEDRILADEIPRTDGFYIEVGAYNGVDMSNTFYFESIGWRGILVEADPELAAQCRVSRSDAIVENCAVVPPNSPDTVTFEITPQARDHSSLSLDHTHQKKLNWLTGGMQVEKITVPALTLNAILQKHSVERIDFITIDVEGHEWGVLRGFSIRKWRPGAVLIERNTPLPDGRIMRYMHRNGYCFRRTTGVNDWFYPSPAGHSKSPAYRFWLFRVFYAPKLWMLMRGKIGRVVKPLLKALKLWR